MFKVGLTGGIGSGKSTVANLFVALGVPIIDADVSAHALVAKGQPALLKIVTLFGPQVLSADGSLNRAALSDIIFADKVQKQQLEALLHPLIMANLQEQVAKLKACYCILVVPLLFETNMTSLVDRVAVVDCDIESQINRVMARDASSLKKTQAIIESQIPRAERLQRADDVINNSGMPQKLLAEQVKTLHNLYLSVAKSVGQ